MAPGKFSGRRQPPNGPRDWGWPGLCQFWTYQQCWATASGTRSYCGINPRYAFARQRQGYWLPY
ncbi:DUF3551 domain-containing protein [Bradyrhizobium elkanii]|uniref:DUF3551 domain-containing protein n=1 Tax=Bradyrhizobium elkanii TaxID=29448 RepID=UPI0009B7C9A6